MVALFGHETEIDRACHDVAGNVRAESEFLFEQCKNASQESELGTIFEYKLGSVSLCRDAFMQILGLPVLNARFLRYETLLRQGVNALPLYEPRPQMRGTKQEVCCQYIHAYVLVHAEKSPREPILLLSRTPLADVEGSYREHLKNTNCVKKSTFRKLWYQQLKVPLADPVSGDVFDILIRRRRAVGFKACDLCCSLRFALMMASMKKLRDIAKEKYLAHLRKVKANREGLQRARVECDGIKVVGVSVDGADFGKFPTPTTKSKAKVLGGMHRIKNKLTGVEFFSGERKIVIFRSLPNVSTGANLTLTIFVRFVMAIAHAHARPLGHVHAHAHTGCSTWATSTRRARCTSIGMARTTTSITRAYTRSCIFSCARKRHGGHSRNSSCCACQLATLTCCWTQHGGYSRNTFMAATVAGTPGVTFWTGTSSKSVCRTSSRPGSRAWTM